MKYLNCYETKLLLFEGQKFLELVQKTIDEDKPFEGRYSVVLETVIQIAKPTLISKGFNVNSYSINVFNLSSANHNETNREKAILDTKSSFNFTDETGISEKELFEYILIEADKNNSVHFFSYVDKVRKKLWELDVNAARAVEKCDFSLLKLGTKYRPFPIVDYQDFFNPST